MLIFIGICYIIYQAIKAYMEDAEMREISRRNGSDWYPSNTGIRDIKTNKKVWINHDGSKEFLE